MKMDAIQPLDLAVLRPEPLQAKPAADIGTDFMALLQAGMTSLERQSDEASAKLAAYATGAQISPHELMIAMESAKLSMQFAVEVRNRLVEAYQELARMQV
ncbi:MAG: putative Flagellar hook-basal body complex protein fliE [Microvirga sp.]|jgi:flagellar hook-basal body complex protein FliE|nr:putative Flagellar hook-basal body complex protein fliE [Microvirga sp.]